MHFKIFSICLLMLPLLSSASVDFKNDREGESYYSSSSSKRSIKRALRDLSENEIIGSYEEMLSELTSSGLCAYDIYENLNSKFKKQNPKFDQFPGAIYFLRSENQFDDIVTKQLLAVHEVKLTPIPTKQQMGELNFPRRNLKEVVSITSEFQSKYLKDTCFDDAYRTLVNDIFKKDSSIKADMLQGIFYEAYQSRKISRDDYHKLEQARINKLESSGFKLKDYYQKISSLRLQYPLRDQDEKSSFVTKKADKMKVSHRQKLFESYTDIQIMFMGNVIKKLRSRLESPKVEILIYSKTNDVLETITLEPMERFRLAIKLLRKEMSYLAINTYFEGRTPSYMDLMVASYELGIIPGAEIEELTKIQEIWNPEKTLWEKSKVWVQTLSTVATIAIPPPYGFLPALAIVIIEATTEKSKNANENDPTSLF